MLFSPCFSQPQIEKFAADIVNKSVNVYGVLFLTCITMNTKEDLRVELKTQSHILVAQKRQGRELVCDIYCIVTISLKYVFVINVFRQTKTPKHISSMNNYSKSSAKNKQPKRIITATHKKCKKKKKTCPKAKRRQDKK